MAISAFVPFGPWIELDVRGFEGFEARNHVRAAHFAVLEPPSRSHHWNCHCTHVAHRIVLNTSMQAPGYRHPRRTPRPPPRDIVDANVLCHAVAAAAVK